MRLIDADAFSAEMKKRQEKCKEWMNKASTDEIYLIARESLGVFCEVKLTLDKMPTITPDMAQVLAYECCKDSVEVVLCKDCRFHEQEQPGMVYCPDTVGGWVEENWFCKGGERRE